MSYNDDYDFDLSDAPDISLPWWGWLIVILLVIAVTIILCNTTA